MYYVQRGWQIGGSLVLCLSILQVSVVEHLYGFGFCLFWNYNTCVDFLKTVADHLVVPFELGLLFIWDFCLARNIFLFQHCLPNSNAIIVKICALGFTGALLRP